MRVKYSAAAALIVRVALNIARMQFSVDNAAPLPANKR